MGGMPQAPPAASGPNARSRNKSQGGGKSNNANASKESRRRRGKAKGAKDRDPSPALDDDANVTRSPALTEVRKTGSKTKVTLAEAMPHLIEFAQDQHGSRFLQNKLDEVGQDERQQVFEAICPEAASLASDVFGNFVVQ